MVAETRTEFGVRFEDGVVWPRDDRAAAELSVRSIQGRHGTATLVQRQVTVTDWTDTAVEPPAEPRNCSCSSQRWHNHCTCGCGTDDSACRAAGCCGVLLADGSTLHPPARLV